MDDADDERRFGGEAVPADGDDGPSSPDEDPSEGASVQPGGAGDGAMSLIFLSGEGPSRVSAACCDGCGSASATVRGLERGVQVSGKRVSQK